MGLVFLTALLSLQAAESITVKVIVDGATIYTKPEIGSNVQARVALDTLLDAEVKEGIWYKVAMEKEGVTISGYIHEMMVEPAADVASDIEESYLAPAEIKSQGEIMAGIELRLEENKALIRANEGLKKSLESLQPLIARTFSIEDSRRQKQIATEIYLWMGLAYAGMNDYFAALIEFRNMFEVEGAYAKEISRNILESEISSLILQAEKEFKGLITDYSLEISTDPKEARIRIDGEEIGLSPEVFRSSHPKFVLEIDKEGYKPIIEEIFLTDATVKKEYLLEKAGRNLQVISDPPGAKVYIDGKDTGEVTECNLSLVSFGSHIFRIEKSFYSPWEKEITVVPGELPQVLQAKLPANVYRYFQKWGGIDSNLFEEPSGIAVDKNNFIYVVDTSSTKLKKFNKDGKLDSALGMDEKELRDLKEPSGLAVDSTGNIYVTDLRKHSVYKFDRNGQFKIKWGQEGNKLQDFQNPSGIAIDSQDHIFIVDSGNSRIKVFSPDGTLTKTWGGRGEGDGLFMYPKAIAVSRGGEVFVADRFRIQHFTNQGEFLGSWGSIRSKESQFNTPSALAVDAGGYVYVADTENHRVQKFDSTGEFITQWGTAGSGDGQFTLPSGLAVDSRGYVFVLEKTGNRLQIFAVPPSTQ